MTQRVRDALDALQALEYTPATLICDILQSNDDLIASERDALRLQSRNIVQLLLCNPPPPLAYIALDTLEAIQYTPQKLFVDLLRSNDARCAPARQGLRDNAVLLLNLLLRDARTPFDRTLAFLDLQGVSPDKFALELFDCSRPDLSATLSAAVPSILPLLSHRNESAVTAWALQYARQFYTAEMLRITHKSAGFHANALHAQPEQFDAFNIDDLATKLRQMAPNLWELFESITDARGSIRRARPRSAGAPALDEWIVGSQDVGAHFDLIAIADDQVEADELDDELDDEDAVPGQAVAADAGVDAMDIDAPAPPPAGLAPSARAKGPSKAQARISALRTIKIVQIFSQGQQGTNQKCNALQVNYGILFRMLQVSDAVVNILNHAGIVVSNKSIDRVVTSLSSAEEKRLLLQGRTLTSQKAFDNFNFMEKVAVPTAGRDSIFRSAISALNISSHPSLTPDHFRFANLTWQTNSAIKIRRQHGQLKPSHPPFEELLTFPDRLDPRPRDPNARSHLAETYAYYIRRILVQQQKKFARYSKFLGDPDEVRVIPPHKTEWDPLRAMDLNQSTVGETIEAVERMLAQTGITDEIAEEYVTFIHGDLGGSERILSAQLFRSIEPTALARFKGVVDVPGLFHTAMASEDAIFRLHVLPSAARHDDNSSSVYKYLELLLPKPVDHNKFKSSSPGPTFRRAHDSFTNIMNGLLLECWLREATDLDSTCTTLDAFAAHLLRVGTPEDAWKVIKTMSYSIADNYVVGKDFDESRKKPDDERDCINENWRLFLSHTLIHTDLYHSIKLQDVGRVSLAIFHLLFVFAAAGKNKYASHMTRVLYNLAVVWPDKLREAFLTSWIINPSGKRLGGRGVDWLVELFNLYIKVIHSGSSSNFGIEQMIKVSPLIKLYKTTFNNFVLNYHLVGRTTKHAPADMTETLDRLRRQIRTDKALEFVPGRSAKYQVPDAMSVGLNMFMTGKSGQLDVGQPEIEHEIEVDMDDFELD